MYGSGEGGSICCSSSRVPNTYTQATVATPGTTAVNCNGIVQYYDYVNILVPCKGCKCSVARSGHDRISDLARFRGRESVCGRLVCSIPQSAQQTEHRGFILQQAVARSDDLRQEEGMRTNKTMVSTVAREIVITNTINEVLK